MAKVEPEEMDLVAIWLRRDPVRWIAGILAGAFAGGLMLVFSMVLAAVLGAELWLPAKLPALPFLGADALEIGMNMKAILIGIVVHELLCSFWGLIFAHFTGTNHLPALLGVGFTWAAFSWIFMNNLFFPSFRDFYVAQIPQGAAFFACLVYGLGLVSVAFFDRVLRG